MKKQIVVVGLGRFGTSVATALSRAGHDVLALDTDGDRVQRASSEVTHAVQADATNEDVLKELGIGNFDIAIVAVGSAVQNSVLSTIIMKRLGVRYVISRANNALHKEILERIGADKVVSPELEMGVRTAHEAIIGAVSDYMPVTSGYGVAKIEVRIDMAGRTLADLELGSEGKLKIAVLLIQREKEVIVTPRESEIVKYGDLLIVSASDDRFESFLAKVKPNKKNNG
jgi:trk system potassium uptake protein TrkA